LRVAKRVGLAGPVRWLVGEHAFDFYHLGRWDEGLGYAEDLIASTETTPHYMEGFARMVRAKIVLGRGGSEGVLTDLDRSLQLARDMKDPQVMYPLLAAAARSYAFLGHSGRAAATADELLRLLRERGQDWITDAWIVDLAIALKWLGRESEVLDVIQAPTAWSDAALAYAKGEFDGAAKLLHEIGSLPDGAEARVRAAEALSAEGRREEAEAQLDRALAFYRDVGATALIAEAERRVPPAESRSAS
jgi:tetratricopeptide (TPR) repeat protein